MSLTMHKSVAGIGNGCMKQLSILVEATIQESKIRGAITCQAHDEESAKRLACQTFITHLRRAGVWSHIDEIDEPYEVEVEGPKDKKTGKPTKKKETKYEKVIQYHAPYWNHVKAIEIIESNSRDLTFTVEELEEAARYENGGIPLRYGKKRRTTNQVAFDKRKQKQTVVAKKEKQLEKKEKAAANKQSKDELLRGVAVYFTGDDPKVIKSATSDLTQTYQRIRYALFQIKDNGYNGDEYDLEQTEIDGSKAFRLVKKGKK